MAIERIERTKAPPPQGSTSIGGPTAPLVSDFASRLSSLVRARGEAPPPDPALTAELLRLQLMEATLSLDAEPSHQATASHQLLQSYGQMSRDDSASTPVQLPPPSVVNEQEEVMALPPTSEASEPFVAMPHTSFLPRHLPKPKVPPHHPQISVTEHPKVSATPPTTRNAPTTIKGPAPQGRYADIISRAAQRYNVPPELISAVIQSESEFNPKAISRAGAQGLMQLMPSTAKLLGVTDSFNPEQNIMAGTRFLADLIRRYRGDIDSALAAYNWGPANVDHHPTSLPKETRDYLAKIKRYVQTFSTG